MPQLSIFLVECLGYGFLTVLIYVAMLMTIVTVLPQHNNRSGAKTSLAISFAAVAAAAFWYSGAVGLTAAALGTIGFLAIAWAMARR